jgi:hypothetical protein
MITAVLVPRKSGFELYLRVQASLRAVQMQKSSSFSWSIAQRHFSEVLNFFSESSSSELQKYQPR